MTWKGPIALFTAWAVHDLEEAVAFPATCDRLAEHTGVSALRMSPRQSWIAVSLMGVVVAAACSDGVRTSGRSALYRSVVAGLEAHVVSHLGASLVRRGYTAGVATAVPVMLPGALLARRQLRVQGHVLGWRDTAGGLALLVPAALACHVAARLVRDDDDDRAAGES